MALGRWAVLWSVGNIMVCVAQLLPENRLVEILTPHWILLSALCAQALAAVLGMRSMTVPYTTDTAHAYVLVLLLLCTSLGVCGALYYPQPILRYGDFLSRSLELQMVVVGCMLLVVGLLLLPLVGPAPLMRWHTAVAWRWATPRKATRRSIFPGDNPFPCSINLSRTHPRKCSKECATNQPGNNVF